MEVLANLMEVPKYSFSKLNSFKGCKYGYKLTYVDKQRGAGNGFSDLGSFVHGLLEDYLNKQNAFENENLYEMVDTKLMKTNFHKLKNKVYSKYKLAKPISSIEIIERYNELSHS